MAEMILKAAFVAFALACGIWFLFQAVRGAIRGESVAYWGLYYYVGGVGLTTGGVCGLMLAYS